MFETEFPINKLRYFFFLFLFFVSFREGHNDFNTLLGFLVLLVLS